MTANSIQTSKTKPVLFSLLTLISGIVIGAGATLIFVGPPKKDSWPPGPEFFSRRIVERMTQELGLIPQQQEAIQSILEKHMTVIDQYREEVRPKIRQEMDTMNNEIMAVLDDNQQQMWKDSIERMQRRFREFRQQRGQRGPGESDNGPRRRDDDQRPGDRRRRNRDDRDGSEQDRFRRPDSPGRDPNSPTFRRRRFEDGMRREDMPERPDMQAPPEERGPVIPTDPNRPPSDMPIMPM